MSIRRLELDVIDHADVLLRIVSVCHRRGCRIDAFHYERLPSGSGRVLLAVEADADQGARLVQWLAKIIHVLNVRQLTHSEQRRVDARHQHAPDFARAIDSRLEEGPTVQEIDRRTQAIGDIDAVGAAPQQALEISRLVGFADTWRLAAEMKALEIAVNR